MAQTLILEGPRQRAIVACHVNGCDRNAHWTAKGAGGYCGIHWYRLRKHGHPEGGRTPQGKPHQFFLDTVLTYEGSDCLIWPFARNSAGYGHLLIGGRHTLTHRLACERTHGPPPTEQTMALHSCANGRRGCCNPHHVRWGTAADNIQDARDHGNMRTGERAYHAVLSSSDVSEIRRDYGRLNQLQLAAKYGVTQSNISSILSRRTWKETP